MDWESDRDKVTAGIGKLKQLGGFTSVKACEHGMVRGSQWRGSWVGQL